MVDIATLTALAVTISSSAIVSADKESRQALEKGAALMAATAGVGQSTSLDVGKFVKNYQNEVVQNIRAASEQLGVNPDKVLDDARAIALSFGNTGVTQKDLNDKSVNPVVRSAENIKEKSGPDGLC